MLITDCSSVFLIKNKCIQRSLKLCTCSSCDYKWYFYLLWQWNTWDSPLCLRRFYRSLKCGSFFSALQALQYSKCLYIFINLWHNLIMCHTVGMFKSSESMFSLTQTPFLSQSIQQFSCITTLKSSNIYVYSRSRL